MGTSASILLTMLLSAALSSPAMAAWPGSPLTNVPLCTDTHAQYTPTIAQDGSGGAIVTWYDYRNGNTNADIYAQRVSANGTPLWGADGIAICTAVEAQDSPLIASDGAGGAIVTWRDFRSGTSWDVYAQRVSAAGAVMWTPDGVEICTAAGHQLISSVVADGAGGAIIAWYDRRVGYGQDDIYAQRISAAGSPLWAGDGLALCTATGDQQFPTILADGTGGAIVTWEDARDYPFNWFVFAQKVSAAGAVQWAADGVQLSTATNTQTFPVIVTDGAGGAIVTWMDYRSGLPNTFAQRVSGAGVVQWAANGVSVCVASGYQYYPQVVADGVGGAIVTWADYRFGNWDIYAQRISGAGAKQWVSSGLIVCPFFNDQNFPTIVADGAGGAIITWMDQRAAIGNNDIYAQRLSALGVPQWAVNGTPLSNPAGSQVYPTIVADGAHGAIVTWYDDRNGNNDVYAQRVQADGQLGGYVAGVPEAALASLRSFPNPFNPQATIRFELPEPGPVRLSLFDAAGHLVRTLVDGSMAPGSHEAVWDGRDSSGRAVGSGTYLTRLESGDLVETARMELIR